MYNLEWVTSLKDRILREEEKKYFDDIIKCYENNLNRACYLLVWLGIVESLKAKIERKQATGIKKAIDAMSEILQQESIHKSVDTLILDKAKECSCIDDFEYQKIINLWTNRCILAHPYSAKITINELNDAIEKLVDYCYSKSDFLSKIEINTRIDDICLKSWIIPLKDDEKLLFFNDLAQSIRTEDKHIAFNYSLEKISKIAEEGFISLNNYTLLKNMRLFLSLIAENEDINNSKYNIKKGIERYPCTAWLGLSEEKIWSKLSEDKKELMFRYIDGSNNLDSFQITCFVKGCKPLVEKDLILELQKDIYYKIIENYYNIKESFILYIDKTKYLERIYNSLIKNNQYIQQNIYIEILQRYFNELSIHFEDMQLIKLGKFLCKCHLNGTTRASNFIFADNINLLPAKFIEGFIFKYFSEFSTSESFSENKFRLINHFFETLDLDLMKNIITTLKSSYNDFSLYDRFKTGFISFVENEKIKNEDKNWFELYDLLISFINLVETKEDNN